MRVWIALVGMALAAPAAAEPPGSVSPMTLPGQGGYIQPGNPDRGISMVGSESVWVRHKKHGRVTCASHGVRERRCKIGGGKVRLVQRIGGRCREGRDWYAERRAVVVTNNCRAVFGTSR